MTICIYNAVNRWFDHSYGRRINSEKSYEHSKAMAPVRFSQIAVLALQLIIIINYNKATKQKGLVTLKQENTQALLWNQAAIKILDIRHTALAPGEGFGPYKLPASMFLFSTRGNAQVLLDGTAYMAKGFQLMHSGKGATLQIVPAGEAFEYYSIFYKATIPAPASQSLLELLKRSNPFLAQYSLIPSSPVLLFHHLQQMHEQWQGTESLRRFQIKALFYQFVYQVLAELEREGSEVTYPDLTAQIMLYMEKNYAEPITLESLAEMFRYSAYHLSATFKQSTGYSPIDYLIRIRLEKAASLLTETDASLRTISAGVGYKDVYYFSRLFKKKLGVSPAEYRRRNWQQSKVADSPAKFPTYSIVERMLNRYIDSDNYYQYTKKGDFPMSRGSRASLAATALLCIMLLLSACSGATSTSNGATAPAQGDANNVAKVETITYKTTSGEVTIPKNPKRVIILADSYVGYFLALGIKPVGLSEFALNHPFYAGKVDGIENIGGYGDDSNSLEKLLELKPDVIIALDNAKNLENIQKIAPTVAIKYGEKNLREQLRAFGKAFGREQEAEAWIANWDSKVAKYKPAVHEVVGDKKVAILGGDMKSLGAFGDFYGRGGEILYREFGLKAPEIIQKATMDIGKGYVALSHEKLPEYAGDFLFIEDSLEKEISKNELWQQLDAVKNKRVYTIDSNTFYFNDPLSLEKQFDYIAGKLLGEETISK
ncbi:AraC family transcriptional regulator [Brevibacillus parabrevis]|jgi:ABC-type Fe3+-hydroxamate transport system, periplasmic component|uniref:AraC family transcriptional regulator n=1 Tax=Brevibacillus parabrevis TaxID=54914 RepID=UPI00249235A1|nr:AraC family transcriptional regulator [Brevibacillus parabrevis]